MVLSSARIAGVYHHDQLISVFNKFSFVYGSFSDINLEIFILCKCVHTGAHKGQNRMSDPLGFESQVVVSHCIGAGNQTL